MCFLDELDHLPVGDEIPLGLGRVREEAAADRQLAPIGSCRLLGNPRAVDPFLGNQSYSRLDLRAGAITQSLEHAATDLELLLWIDLAHGHISCRTQSDPRNRNGRWRRGRGGRSPDHGLGGRIATPVSMTARKPSRS